MENKGGKQKVETGKTGETQGKEREPRMRERKGPKFVKVLARDMLMSAALRLCLRR